MNIKLKCKYCNRKFLCCLETTKINGTMIELKCPHCGKHSISNMSKFCEDYVGNIDTRLYRSGLMIDLAHNINRLINNDYGN